MNRRSSSFAMRSPPRPIWEFGHYFLALMLLLCWMSTNAHAERRVALVIGNADYIQQKNKLKNPINDAIDINAKLKALGFREKDIVYRENLKVDDIAGTLAEFGRKLVGEGNDDRDTVAVIYYSGHGIQFNDKNYLPAVNAKIDDEISAKYQSIVVSDLMNLMESGKSRVNLVFLDACRNNPFSSGRKSFTRGLSKESPPTGIWIWYATRPGQEADDGDGRNSPFTEQILKHIGTPGLSIKQMFDPVASGVKEATKYKERPQEPWPEGWISGDFYFAQSSTTPKSVPVAVAQTKPAQTATVTQPPQMPAAAQGPQPGQVIKDCAECPELVVLPRGSFTMGSPDSEPERYTDEGPTHVVRIDYQLAVGRFEVTQGQWKALMGNNPSYFNTCGDNCPVENVSWNDAQEFVRKISARTSQEYRLLTEAEWEYAARAGTRTWFSTGNRISPEQSNFNGSIISPFQFDFVGEATPADEFDFDSNEVSNGSAKRIFLKKTIRVGRFRPNAFGLYDMHGNVWEWVQDVYHENYMGAPADGGAWESVGDAMRRILRGGSWYDTPRYLRSAYRNRFAPDGRSLDVGFRVAKTL